MRSFSSPAVASIAESATLTDAVMEHAERRPAHVLYRRRAVAPAGRPGIPVPQPVPPPPTTWTPVSAATFRDEVVALAKGFLAVGLRPGDRVGLLSRTRYEWTLTDFALWHAGLVTVPVYETSSPEQVNWILGDSQAMGVVVESPEHAATVESLRDQLPDLRDVWVIEHGDLDRLATAGRRADDRALDQARATVNARSLATVIYTSGTTGRPKGCALTHHNLLFGATSAVESLPALFDENTSALLFLPLAHVLARDIQVATLIAAVPVGHCPDTRNLHEDLLTFQPTMLLAVPYVFEKLYAVAHQRAAAKGQARLFALATRVAVRASRARDDGGAGRWLRAERAVFDWLVFRKLRAALGGKVVWVISGGAPLGTRLGHFFRGAGTTVLEGWGLTESTAAAAVNRPDAARIGTVGPPLAGTTIAVADDGELLVRGEHVFDRYWGDPAGTKAVLDDDGWLHTGDIGDIDAEGFVTITGRRKELLVTAGGKNVSPALLEDRLHGHPLIEDSIVVGDRRPYVACLITLDREALDAWKVKVAKDPGLTLEQLRDDPDLVAEIQAAVDEANRVVSRAESIRRFRILGVNFSEAGGQLTPTHKLKRAVVLDQFADDVEALYPAARPGSHVTP